MARPSTIHDLNDYEKYEVLAEFNLTSLIDSKESLLTRSRQMILGAELVAEEEPEYYVERSGGFVRIKRLKHGSSAEDTLRRAQDEWDRKDEQYHLLKGFGKIPEGGSKIPRWSLNHWARDEGLPNLTEAEYAGLRPVPPAEGLDEEDNIYVGQEAPGDVEEDEAGDHGERENDEEE